MSQPTAFADFHKAQKPFHLVYDAIEALNLHRVKEAINALPSSKMLNAEMPNCQEGSQRVTFLCSVANVRAKTPEETQAKLAIITFLLNAGATNVNVGYYMMGVSYYTAFQAACDASLWPGITQEEHRALVSRMHQLGGKPNYRLHPLALTARQVAEMCAPYLLNLLPINEETDGQLALFAAHAEMPRQDSPALERRNSWPFWGS